jgi:hypothetical protein
MATFKQKLESHDPVACGCYEAAKRLTTAVITDESDRSVVEIVGEFLLTYRRLVVAELSEASDRKLDAYAMGLQSAVMCAVDKYMHQTERKR